VEATAITGLTRRRAAKACAVTAALTWLACACTTTAPMRPKEVLDESSGVTLIVAQKPMVFARPRIDVAANVRDYFTLAAAEEDRSGRYTAWLIAYRWSTVDPRMESRPAPAPPLLHIIADDRELTLKPAEPAPAILARGDLLLAPHVPGAQSAAYAVDEATLRYIATSTRLLLRVDDDTALPAYAVWDDGREALQALLLEVGSP
jgi:hypothetical protein